jgi:outer membrane protein OmpA-like peptidoglycan-associated protein
MHMSQPPRLRRSVYVRYALTLLVSALLPLLPAAGLAQPKLRLEIREGDIDVAARILHFRLSGGSVERVDMEVFSPEGEALYTGHEDYAHAAPGAPLDVSWPDLGKRGENFRMELKFSAAGGTWVTFQIIRFYIEVPHEEVEFDSGKWDVKPDQQAKLDKPLSLLKEAAAKYSSLMNVSLYVAGHTDTVGQAADNQRLSERRAQAIAQWLTHHGLRGIPVYVRGFGEGALAVHTADNVPEQRNRRAQYIVSSFAPPLAGPGSWKRMQ